MARPKMPEPVPSVSNADVAQHAAQWDEGVLQCRTYGHVWQPSNATHNKRYRYYSIVQLCPRCGTERNMELSERGHVYASWYSYPEDYLVVGLGRIMGEGRDVLRMATITRTYNITEITGKAAMEDTPRARATREAIE